MTLQCNICGKKVSAGEGQDTSYGFVCFDCYNARNFQLCAECGRRFPRDEMIEWNGLYYCRSDYFFVKDRYERIKEEERKKKEIEEAKKRPPLVKPGAGLGIQVHKKRREIDFKREEILSLIRERKETKKISRTKEGGTINSNDDYKSLINAISSLTSKPLDAITDAAMSPLGDVSLSAVSKKKRRDALAEALNELHSILRSKRDKR